MVLSAEDYSMRAAFYAKAADDEVAPRELRLVFARKANWFHILARLEEKKKGFGQRTATHLNKAALAEEGRQPKAYWKLFFFRRNEWQRDGLSCINQQTQAALKPQVRLRGFS